VQYPDQGVFCCRNRDTAVRSKTLDTILVAGATGTTGREILRLARSRVDTVRALTRSPDAATALQTAGADEVVVDDLLASDDLSAAVVDVDAVLSAVGTAPTALRSGRATRGNVSASASIVPEVDSCG